MNKALLVISFGTTVPEAEETCIAPVEDALREAFPGAEVRRAYSSAVILKKLRGSVHSIPEALRLMTEAGLRPFAVPTNIIPGAEYERVRAAVGDHPVSAPLLQTDGDVEWMACVLGEIAAEEGRALILMGHGTEHESDAVYSRLRAQLPPCVFLACVSGSLTLDSLLGELDALPDKRVCLMPLMLVAGKHARDDLAGDGEDSWKSILERRGFDVRVRMQGLGAVPAVRRRFVEKAAIILMESL